MDLQAKNYLTVSSRLLANETLETDSRSPAASPLSARCQ